MKINSLVFESKQYLYEGLTSSERASVKLWESAGYKLFEANLTPEQITKIFQQVEQGLTAAGGNRSLIGRGVDVAGSVNKAWNDLKNKVSTSGPIKNVDAAYDSAAAKLKQATGGDKGVMQYVQKYRDFAKKHPVAQGLIYAALIAAAGVSGAGVGGAAALGLFKMVDKLLQGEKFSSAAYSGAKTGALAYGAGQLGQAMKGGDAVPGDQWAAAGPGETAGETTYNIQRGDTLSQIAQKNGVSVKELMQVNPQITDPNVIQAGQTITIPAETGSPVYQGGVGLGGPTGASTGGAVPSPGGGVTAGPNPGIDDLTRMKALSSINQEVGQNVYGGDAAAGAASGSGAPTLNLGGGNSGTVNIPGTGEVPATVFPADGMQPRLPANAEKIEVNIGGKPVNAFMYGGKVYVPNFKAGLSESQIKKVFTLVEDGILTEGILDTIKGSVGKLTGKAADWAKTKAGNITTKITADKLMQAWKSAGSKTDSEDVKKVMLGAGVPQNIIDSVFAQMGIGSDSGATPDAGAAEVGTQSSTGGSTFSQSGSTVHKAAAGREEMQQQARDKIEAEKQARAAASAPGSPQLTAPAPVAPATPEPVGQLGAPAPVAQPAAPKAAAPSTITGVDAIKKAYAGLDKAERDKLRNELDIIDDQERLASGTNESLSSILKLAKLI